MQFAAGGAFAHTWLWSDVGLGFAWAAAFISLAFVVFRIRTRVHLHTTPGASSTVLRPTSAE